MQTRFCHQNHFTYVSEWNKYSKSIATQLFYQHTPIDTGFMENSCVITLKLNTLTDVLYEMTVGGGICLRMWKRPRRPRYNGVAVYIYVMNSLGTEDDWK